MPNTISDTMPVIDWQLGTSLAGNKLELAKDLLQFLVKNLSTDIVEIQQAYKNNNIPQLKKLVHKLHGATSYCGVPRLTFALTELNTALKQNNHDLDSLVTLIEFEAAQVIKKASE